MNTIRAQWCILFHWKHRRRRAYAKRWYCPKCQTEWIEQ